MDPTAADPLEASGQSDTVPTGVAQRDKAATQVVGGAAGGGGGPGAGVEWQTLFNQHDSDETKEYMLKLLEAKMNDPANQPAIIELSFARIYWADWKDKGGTVRSTDDPPPAGATVSIRQVRESFYECFCYWPIVSHPNTSLPRYVHSKAFAEGETAVLDEVEFSIFCLDSQAFGDTCLTMDSGEPPDGCVSIAGVEFPFLLSDDFSITRRAINNMTHFCFLSRLQSRVQYSYLNLFQRYFSQDTEQSIHLRFVIQLFNVKIYFPIRSSEPSNVCTSMP